MAQEIQEVILAKYLDGRYAAMDQASGGYPYPVDSLFRAKIWTNMNEFFSYLRSFPELAAYVVRMEITTTKLEKF